MREVIAVIGNKIPLGRRGENMATCVVFDISEWLKTYGEGTVQLIHQRNGDATPYPCVVEQDGSTVRWCITGADVDVAGRGLAELQYYVGDVLVKSSTYTTATDRAMGSASEEAPEPHNAWVDNVLQAANDAVESAASAEEAAAAAEASAEALAESERNAAASEQAAQDAASDAAASQRAAADSEKAAADSEARAESYAKQAEGAVTGVTSFNGRNGHVMPQSGDYTADMAGAVSKSGDTMTGNLNINGNSGSTPLVLKSAMKSCAYAQMYDADGTTLGFIGFSAANEPSVVGGDGSWLKLLHSGNVGDYAAPAGFGLGVVSWNIIADCNQPEQGNGFYALTSTTLNAPTLLPMAVYGVLLSQIRGDKVFQTLRQDGYIATRSGNLATQEFSEWEYVNPPMQLGVEYRTTERYLGKPVYAKLVYFGALANAATGYVEHGIVNIERVVSVSAEAKYPNATAISLIGHVYIEYVEVTDGSISIKTKIDLSGYTAHVLMKYTKTTD